jgi:small subunit ribosomal protein S20
MPNIKSAKKRLRQNAKSQERNQVVRSRVRTARRSFKEAVDAGEVEAATKAYSLYCSFLDKAAKTNVIAKNNATRSKSRAAALLRGASA